MAVLGGLASIILFIFIAVPMVTGIPIIIIDTDTKSALFIDHDNNPATDPIQCTTAQCTEFLQVQNDNSVTGIVVYDMALVYTDGSMTLLTEAARFPDTPFSTITTSDNKELERISINATGKLLVPQQVSNKVRVNADVTSNLKVYLNNVVIHTFDRTSAFSVNSLKQGTTILSVSLPVESISIGSGTYSLSFQDSEKIKFYLHDSTEKVVELNAAPSFKFEKEGDRIKALSVVNTKGSAVAVIEKVPEMGQDCSVNPCRPILVGYTTDIVIKAANYNPLSSIKFDYTTTPDQPYKLIKYVVVEKTTDLLGSAEDRYHWNSLNHPACYEYYALFKVTDGESESRGKVGCSYYSVGNLGWQYDQRYKLEQDFLAGN